MDSLFALRMAMTGHWVERPQPLLSPGPVSESSGAAWLGPVSLVSMASWDPMFQGLRTKSRMQGGFSRMRWRLQVRSWGLFPSPPLQGK